MKSAFAKQFVSENLAIAERELELGPDGTGWLHNSSLRPKYKAKAEFFRTLIKLVN